MINVDQKNQVERVLGKLRVVIGTQHRPNIGHLAGRHVLFQQPDHLRLNVLTVNDAGRPHPFRHAEGEVTHARANVGNGGTGLQIQGVQRLVGVLFLYPFGAH